MPTAKKIRAFTLVELLVVVAIIGILSVGAYVGIQGTQIRAKNNRVLDDLLAIANSLEQYRLDHDGYPLPEPNGNQNILCYYADATYAHDCDLASFRQGVIDNYLLGKQYLQEVPLDPHTGTRYAYGVSNDGKFFEIAGLNYIDGRWVARTVDNLAKGFTLPSVIRAYNSPNFVMDRDIFLPYDQNAAVLSATLMNISGTVQVEYAEGQVAQTVPPGSDPPPQVYKGATVITEADGSVDLFFSDGSETTLEPGTTLKISEAEISPGADNFFTKIRLYLFNGRIWNKVARLAQKSEFNIETTTAIAAVQGTDFGLDVGGDNNTPGREANLLILAGEVGARIKTDNERQQKPGAVVINKSPGLDENSRIYKAALGREFTKFDLTAVSPATPAEPAADDTDWVNKLKHIRLSNSIRPYVVSVEPGPIVTIANRNHFIKQTLNPDRELDARSVAVFNQAAILDDQGEFNFKKFLKAPSLGCHDITADDPDDYTWTLGADILTGDRQYVFAFQNKTCTEVAASLRAITENPALPPSFIRSAPSNPPLKLTPTARLNEDTMAILNPGQTEPYLSLYLPQKITREGEFRYFITVNNYTLNSQNGPVMDIRTNENCAVNKFCESNCGEDSAVWTPLTSVRLTLHSLNTVFSGSLTAGPDTAECGLNNAVLLPGKPIPIVANRKFTKGMMEMIAGPETDTTPPDVVSALPAGGSVPPETTQLVITFNEPVKRAARGNIQLAAGRSQVAVTDINPATDTLTAKKTVTVTTPLTVGTAYTATLDHGTFTDEAGNPMTNAYSWKFTILAAAVAITGPDTIALNRTATLTASEACAAWTATDGTVSTTTGTSTVFTPALPTKAAPFNTASKTVTVTCTPTAGTAVSKSFDVTYAPADQSETTNYDYSYFAASGRNWEAAKADCAALTEGGVQAGTWHLPNYSALSVLTTAQRQAEGALWCGTWTSPACSKMNGAGKLWLNEEQSATNAWMLLGYNFGTINSYSKTSSTGLGARCVK